MSDTIKQNYWISIYKRGDDKRTTFKTFKQTYEEMYEVVEIILHNYSVEKVEVQGTKDDPNIWKEFSIIGWKEKYK